MTIEDTSSGIALGIANARRTNNDQPTVSAIIPTCNSESTLKECINSLLNQSGHAIEIVVVDGGSRDGTIQIAKMLGATVISGEYRRSDARRAGVEVAHGEVVLFLDSDQVASPDLVEECAKAMGSDSKTAIWIPEVDRGQGIWFRCYELDRAIAMDAGLVYPRFFRRSEYLEIGGHSSHVQDFMEDRELWRRWVRSGGVTRRAQTALVNDCGRTNPISLGAKGAKAAIDAAAYYATTAEFDEKLVSVLVPRIRAFIGSRIARSFDLTTFLAFPAYLVMSRLPRVLAVSIGIARSRPMNGALRSG